MTRGRLGRAAGGLAIAVAGVVPLLVTGTAEAATGPISVQTAAGSQVAPSGTDSTFGDVLTITAQVHSGWTGTLTLTPPAGTNPPLSPCTAGTGTGGTISFALDTRSFADQQPIKRLLTPEEVAAALVWLAAPASGALTGAVIPVDGGLSL